MMYFPLTREGRGVDRGFAVYSIRSIPASLYLLLSHMLYIFTVTDDESIWKRRSLIKGKITCSFSFGKVIMLNCSRLKRF